MTSTNIEPLYLIINKTNGYIKENNRNKYLTLLPTDARKDTLKSIKNHKAKIHLSNSKPNNLGNHHVKYRKTNLIQMTIYFYRKR